MSSKPFYTTNEAGLLLGLSPRSITKYVELGQITAEKMGRDWIITAEELERFKNTPRKVGRPAQATLPTDKKEQEKPTRKRHSPCLPDECVDSFPPEVVEEVRRKRLAKEAIDPSRADKFMEDLSGTVWYDPDGKMIGDGSLEAMQAWKKKDRAKSQD